MKVNYVNKKYVKENKFNLRKIAVGLGLASAILISTNLITNKEIDDVKERYVTENNMENFNDFEIGIINSLQNYENSYKAFNNDPSVENRMDLVNETKNLSGIADRLIEEKINNAMETNANIQIVNVTDGERAIMADNEIVTNKVPYALNGLFNAKDFIDNVYQGDGSNSIWESQMKDFNKKGLNLYKSILSNVDINYSYQNDKFKELDEDIKTK